MENKKLTDSSNKRGKGGTSFVSVIKAILDKGITDRDEIIKLIKKELPGLDEKKIRARVNPAIKYLGKTPVKKVKAEKVEKKVKKEEKRVETPIVESPKVADTVVDTQVESPEVQVETPKTETPVNDTDLGDVLIQ